MNILLIPRQSKGKEVKNNVLFIWIVILFYIAPYGSQDLKKIFGLESAMWAHYAREFRINIYAQSARIL